MIVLSQSFVMRQTANVVFDVENFLPVYVLISKINYGDEIL